MATYLNLNGDSPVSEYDIGNTYIVVHFNSGTFKHYRYDYNVTGEVQVEEMKRLAKQGYGLCSYINKFIKTNYQSKW